MIRHQVKDSPHSRRLSAVLVSLLRVLQEVQEEVTILVQVQDNPMEVLTARVWVVVNPMVAAIVPNSTNTDSSQSNGSGNTSNATIGGAPTGSDGSADTAAPANGGGGSSSAADPPSGPGTS